MHFIVIPGVSEAIVSVVVVSVNCGDVIPVDVATIVVLPGVSEGIVSVSVNCWDVISVDVAAFVVPCEINTAIINNLSLNELI